MPRRASSSQHPVIWIVCAIAIAAAAFVGKSMLGKENKGLTGGTKLNMSEVLENANSMRGNEYIVAGTIDTKLRVGANSQVISLKVEGSGELLPIEVPAEFIKLNLEVQQSYSIKVKFRQGGIAVATAMQRL